MNKGWSILFGVVMAACFGLFVAAPFVGWWLPKNVSSFGGDVDDLFYLILWITGFFFVLTEALLVYFMFVYAGRPDAREHPVGHHYAEKKVFWTSFFKRLFRPVSAILHDQHRVELAWTIVPAVVLLYIAFAQIETWARIKDPANMPRDPDVALVVSARMFEWRMSYPASLADGGSAKDWADARLKAAFAGKVDKGEDKGEVDDIHVTNEVHVYQEANVKVLLRTRDVIHSFYLPNLRLKQDALPGKTIPVWFRVTDYNTVPVDRDGLPTAWSTNPPVKWVDGYQYDKDKEHAARTKARVAREKEQRARKATGKKARALRAEARSLRRDARDLVFNNHEQIWELACAELCGWGHYKMRGKLFVHKDARDFQNWLKAARAQQLGTQPEK